MGHECDEGVVAITLAEKLPTIFDYLEANVRCRDFLIGDSLSIGDVAIACMLVNFERARASLDKTRRPETRALHRQPTCGPSFQTSVAEERRFLERQRAA